MGILDRIFGGTSVPKMGTQALPADVHTQETPMTPERLKGRLSRLKEAYAKRQDPSIGEEIARLEAIRASYL